MLPAAKRRGRARHRFPKHALVRVELPALAVVMAASGAVPRGARSTKRPLDCMAPAIAPASSPLPKKISPRPGPTMAEPVSCATRRCRNGRRAGRIRHIRLDPDRRMKCVQSPVDREAASRREKDPGRTRRSGCRIGRLHLAEENEGSVGLHHGARVRRMRGKPGTDGLHRYAAWPAARHVREARARWACRDARISPCRRYEAPNCPAGSRAPIPGSE